MSRPRQSPATERILAQGRELLELSRRAIALGQALQALTGSTPQGAGEGRASEAQAHVATMLDRAEVAMRQLMGPAPATAQVRRRARHHFI
jgi:hypothetical protein